MQKHTKEYFTKLGLDPHDCAPCELCGRQGVDVHHVRSRSHFGSKMKGTDPGMQDHIDNLIMLCRQCHNLAHDMPMEQLTIIYQAIEARKLNIGLIL